MKKFEIYRGIAINEGEVISENIGCSWSLDRTYADAHAEMIMSALGKDGYILLKTEVAMDDIAMDSTLFALETRVNEYEIVLKDCKIKAVVDYAHWVEHIIDGDVVNGSAGNNYFEDYTNDYTGELTIKDLIEIIESFQG